MTHLAVSENWITVEDGTKLFYRAWLPAGKPDKAILLFHRGHEHSGRLQELAEALALEGAAIFAWDARGNGKSEGERDYAASFSCYLKDADLFARHISTTYGIALENFAVVGHSVGAAIAAAWIHDFAPPVRALVLATPAFRIRLYLPFAIPLLRLAQWLGIMKKVPSYVKAKVLTHDPEQIETHDADKLITHSISTNILLDLYDTSTRVIQDAGAIQVSTLLLTAGADWVVDIGAQRRFFERLGAPVKRREFYPGFYHAIFHEKERHRPMEKVREFLVESFQKSGEKASLLHADKEGYTKVEYDALRRPLPPFCLKGMAYAVSRLLMSTVGRLSTGVRLGWESGFNSGRTLDYVYENSPNGTICIGRAIDRTYLNGVGWRGIRIRRGHLERLIRKYAEDVHGRQGRVHIVDIATGGGRYVVETLKKLEPMSVTAELRDFEPKNLEVGRKHAELSGVKNVVFIKGDAFDRTSLAALSPKPDIAIVSGLYELFPENEQVLNSLQGLADAVPEGGYLIYTNQPWHPQLELIARVLCNWDGKPWVMRRRTQAEMDELVRQAGFQKIEMEIDQWGIFTVSVARRVRK